MGRYYQSSGPARMQGEREGWRATKLTLLRGTIAPNGKGTALPAPSDCDFIHPPFPSGIRSMIHPTPADLAINPSVGFAKTDFPRAWR